MSVRITVNAHTPITDFVFGFGLFNADGVCCYGTNTYLEEMTPVSIEGVVTASFFGGSLLLAKAGRAAAVRQQAVGEHGARLERWGLLERGQQLEVSLFLSQYLLSSLGDRVAMAHSVEGRHPFLDDNYPGRWGRA